MYLQNRLGLKNLKKQLDSLVSDLKNKPQHFLLNNQDKNVILEFKASVELDTALRLCKFIGTGKKENLNQVLSLRILETLVAFANSYGGLLIIGVAESKGQIIGKAQRKRYEQSLQGKNKRFIPCFSASENQYKIRTGKLNICGSRAAVIALNRKPWRPKRQIKS